MSKRNPSFRISGLSAEPFKHLFGLSCEALAEYGVERHVADKPHAFPDRVALVDAEPGESLLLLNYTHQNADNPYRASHAIFIRESDAPTFDKVNEIPEVLRRRIVSLRAFNESNRLVDAEVAEGKHIETAIERFLRAPNIAYLHAHYAKHGCYAARIDRG